MVKIMKIDAYREESAGVNVGKVTSYKCVLTHRLSNEDRLYYKSSVAADRYLQAEALQDSKDLAANAVYGGGFYESRPHFF